MENENPTVGDAWTCEGNDGKPVERRVTEVCPPLNPGDEWSIALDGSDLVHLGWWYGQGWEERDV